MHMSCNGTASELQMQITGELVLNKKFIPEHSETNPSILEAAVKEQLQFARHLSHAGNKKNIRFYSPRFDFENIKITSVKEVPYALTLNLDNKKTLFGAESSYLSAAFKSAKTAANDPALLVQYIVDFSGAICTNKPELKEKIFTDLPRDPYLAYWLVPEKGRIETTWRQAKTKITPCADSEFADIPAPNFYWYFWDTTKSKCKLEKSAIYTAQIKIKSTKQFKSESPDFFVSQKENDEPIRITGIFGWMDTQREPTAEINAVYDSLQNFFLNKAPAQQNVSDPSSLSVLKFSREIANYFGADRVLEIKRQKNNLVFEIRGKVKDSQRPVSIRVFWGATDTLSPSTPKHWPILKDALAQDDMIIYSGHSGLGENMNWKKYSPDPNFKSTVPHQTIALLSCYTYSYFQPELFQGNADYSVVRDIVYTGSAVGESGDAALGLVRSLLKINKQGRSIAELAQTDDFFFVKRFIFSANRGGQ